MIKLQPDACVPFTFALVPDPESTPIDADTAVYVEFGYDPVTWHLTEAVAGAPQSRTILIAGPDAPTPTGAVVVAASCGIRFAIGATTDGPPRPTGLVDRLVIASGT